MAKKSVEIIFWLRDKISPSLKTIKSGVKGVGVAIAALAKIAAAAFAGMSAGAAGVAASVKKSFEFETARTQLKSLLGTTTEATKRFDELKKMADETPFQLPDILKASRLLTTFSEGALGGAESLRGLGDAAAATNQNISDVAFWVGRAYSMIQGGKPFGEAAMRLQEMAILSAEARNKMEELQKAGASSSQVFGVLTKEFSKFEGGMIDLSQTGDGLISTLKGNWDTAVAEFGNTFVDASKDGIQALIDKLKELVASGKVKEWAENLYAGLVAVKNVVVDIKSAFSSIGKALSPMISAIKKFADYAEQAFDRLSKIHPSFFISGQIKRVSDYSREKIGSRYEDAKAQIEKEKEAKAIQAANKARSDELKSIKERIRAQREEAKAAKAKVKADKLAAEKVKETAKAQERISKEGSLGGFAEIAAKLLSTGNDTREVAKQISKIAEAEVFSRRSGVEGGGGIMAELLIAGKTLREASVLSKQVAEAEVKGRQVGFAGAGGIAADLIRQGFSGRDLSQAISSVIKAQVSGEQVLGVDLDDPVLQTNKLLEQQNKILAERLGGVSGGE